ncbi:MAG: N-acetylmuramoyl-L-alanine amidase [Bradyrhizobium sp.]
MLSLATKSIGAGFGVWSRRRAIIAAVAALVLLPIEASDAGWLSDVFKRASKSADQPKRVTSPNHTVAPKRANAATKHAAAPRRQVSALGAGAASPSTSKPVTCDPTKFRVVVDVGHTAKSEGAISARNVAEFVFNLRLAQRIEEKLKAEGFAATRLLVTEGRARPSLVRRVNFANNMPANLFLSIHHDSVPDKLLEDWEFEGKKRHFSDRFSGHSVFVARTNADFKASLAFAELLGGELKAKGLVYAKQFTMPIMGKNQHPLLNRETGVYSYDKLIVLKSTKMPAVLLEAGSIINRDEELKMDSPERRDLISSGVATAMKKFCDARRAVVAQH